MSALDDSSTTAAGLAHSGLEQKPCNNPHLVVRPPPFSSNSLRPVKQISVPAYQVSIYPACCANRRAISTAAKPTPQPVVCNRSDKKRRRCFLPHRQKLLNHYDDPGRVVDIIAPFNNTLTLLDLYTISSHPIPGIRLASCVYTSPRCNR